MPLCLCLLAQLSFSTSYAADFARLSCSDDELSTLVDNLLAWIGENSNYDSGPSRLVPPEIRSCISGGRIMLSGTEFLVEEGLRGAYGPAKRVIYLVEPWDSKDLVDQSRLLHELVHDVQSLTRVWTCPREQEWDAYKLQDTWLEQNGIDSDFNWARILVLSRCRPDVHE